MAKQQTKLIILGKNAILTGAQEALRSFKGVSGSSAAALLPDSKRPQVWLRDNRTNRYVEFDVLGNKPSGGGFSIDGETWTAVAVQTDSLTGDVYALECLNNASTAVIGGRVLCQQQSKNKATEFILTSTETDTSLASPMDMKLDSVRRRLWIADTINHRVLQVSLTGKIQEEYKDSNFVAPSSLIIDPESGDVFVRWYDSFSMEERVSRLSEGSIQSTYKSPGSFGWETYTRLSSAESALFVDRGSGRNGVYKISSKGAVRLVFSSGNSSPLGLSTDETYGTCMAIFEGGFGVTIDHSLNVLDSFQYNNPGESSVFFPSHFDVGYWLLDYDFLTEDYRMVKKKPRGVQHTVTEQSEYHMDSPISGRCSTYDMSPVVLLDGGMTLARFDRFMSRVLQKIEFDHPKHFFEVEPSSGIVYVASIGEYYLSVYDRALNFLADIQLPYAVYGMELDWNNDHSLWIKTGNNVISKGYVLGSFVEPVFLGFVDQGSISLGYEGDDIRSMSRNQRTGGLWVCDAHSIYMVNRDASASSCVFYDASADLVAISGYNRLSEIQKNPRSLPGPQSMAYDYLRKQLWWITDGWCKNVCMVNFNSDSGRSLQAYCEESSSQSSSSYSTVSSSSLTSLGISSGSSMTGDGCVSVLGTAAGTEWGVVGEGYTYQYQAWGTIYHCKIAGEQTPSCPVNPDGEPGVAGIGFLAPDLKPYSLIGRIGTGDYFQLGLSGYFVAKETGVLKLYINDTQFIDNSGSWGVCVLSMTTGVSCKLYENSLVYYLPLDEKSGARSDQMENCQPPDTSVFYPLYGKKNSGMASSSEVGPPSWSDTSNIRASHFGTSNYVISMWVLPFDLGGQIAAGGLFHGPIGLHAKYNKTGGGLEDNRHWSLGVHLSDDVARKIRACFKYSYGGENLLGEAALYSSLTISSIAYTHIVGVYTPSLSTARLYVNGALSDVLSVTSGIPIPRSGMSLRFPSVISGDRSVGTTANIGCIVDEIAYWTDVGFNSVSDIDNMVSLLYNNQLGRFYRYGFWLPSCSQESQSSSSFDYGDMMGYGLTLPVSRNGRVSCYNIGFTQKPPIPNIGTPFNAITFEAIIKIDYLNDPNRNNRHHTIFWHGDPNNPTDVFFEIYLLTKSDCVEMHLRNTTDDRILFKDGARDLFFDNEFHHIEMDYFYDVPSERYWLMTYIDGRSINSQEVPILWYKPVPSRYNLSCIGSKFNPSEGALVGTISMLALHNSARHMSIVEPVFVPSPNPIIDYQTMLACRFEEGAGFVTKDDVTNEDFLIEDSGVSWKRCGRYRYPFNYIYV